MTWLWPIFFSAVLAAQLAAAPVAGRVELRDSRDAAVRSKRDYSGVVVWLERAGEALPATPARHAQMVQKDKVFTPHVLAVTTGTTVDFPNFDPIFHNAFSNYNGQVFDVGLYPPGKSRSVKFTKPGIVRIFCNIHASMSAVIAVLNTANFAVTGADGSFHIDVPPGDYTLQVFHERASDATLNALTRHVTVGADGLALPAISISEAGYLTVPHRDKYGHPYPPASADGVYPAVH
jgi:plastocyanin